MQMTPNQVIFLRENRAKIPWRSESKKRPMPIEGIKMSLIHSCPPPPPIPYVSYSVTLSHSWIWDGGQVPPRTLRLINHPHFNICPVPNVCPPPPHPLWRWVLGFIPLSASLHTPPLTPPPWPTKHLLSHAQVKKRPSFPFYDKSRLKPRWGLPAEMPGSRQGCLLSPLYFSPAFWFIHPLVSLSFFIFNTPLLWGSLTQLAPNPFHTSELSASHKDIKWQQWEKTARFGRKRYSTWLSVAILHAFCSLGCSWNR